MRRHAHPVGALSYLEAAVLASLPSYTLRLVDTLKGLGLRVQHQTLYVIVQRLRDDGLIRTAWATPGQVRDHTLTARGRTALDHTLRYWGQIARKKGAMAQ